MPALKKESAETSRPLGPKRETAVAPDLRTKDTREDSGYDPSQIVDPVNSAVEEDIETYSPQDKIPAGEVLFIRNNTQSVVRLADSPKEALTKFNLRFAPAGNEDSIVSIDSYEVLRNPGFQKWWRQGKFTVTSDSSIQPIHLDSSQREIDRLQQLSQEGTLSRTAPGSLPVPKELDLDFLDQFNPNSPKFKG